MTPHPDPIFHCAGLRPAGTPTLADRPPDRDAKGHLQLRAARMLEGGWTPRGAHDGRPVLQRPFAPRPRRFSLDAALRRATYDLRGRQYRNWLDPEDTAGAALTALSGHIHSMLGIGAARPTGRLPSTRSATRRSSPPPCSLPARISLPEYPGLRPRTETKRRKAGVHAFLVEGR